MHTGALLKVSIQKTQPLPLLAPNIIILASEVSYDLLVCIGPTGRHLMQLIVLSIGQLFLQFIAVLCNENIVLTYAQNIFLLIIAATIAPLCSPAKMFFAAIIVPSKASEQTRSAENEPDSIMFLSYLILLANKRLLPIAASWTQWSPQKSRKVNDKEKENLSCDMFTRNR
jgi:hypothetical protein